MWSPLLRPWLIIGKFSEEEGVEPGRREAKPQVSLSGHYLRLPQAWYLTRLSNGLRTESCTVRGSALPIPPGEGGRHLDFIIPSLVLERHSKEC